MSFQDKELMVFNPRTNDNNTEIYKPKLPISQNILDFKKNSQQLQKDKTSIKSE